MTNSKLTVLLGVVFFVLSALQATAQESAVGLYYPDFRSIRRLIDPTGSVTLPKGPQAANLEGPWKQISKNGRDLLLKERDLAMVVVDSNGNWLYRSTGIHTLRSLHAQAEERNKSDLSNLRRILDDPLFQQLRAFYGQLLSDRGTALSAETLGPLLAEIDKIPNVGPTDKDWFHGLIGSEISHLEPSARVGLWTNKTYGKSLINASAAAEGQKVRQLDLLESAFNKGPKGVVYVTDVAFDSKTLPAAGSAAFTIRALGGKQIFEWETQAGTLFVAPNSDVDETVLFGARNDPAKLFDLIKGKKASVFLGVPGGSKLLSVEAKPK